MNSGQLLVNGSDFYVGNSVNSLIQLGLKSEIDSCFQSVSNGKALVASAITDKGVETAADATFQQMANNINSISPLDTSDANASAEQILSGYTAYVNGSKIIGNMTNRGAVSRTIDPGESYTIPAGYHNGSGRVSASDGSGIKIHYFSSGLKNASDTFTINLPFNASQITGMWGKGAACYLVDTRIWTKEKSTAYHGDISISGTKITFTLPSSPTTLSIAGGIIMDPSRSPLSF